MLSLFDGVIVLLVIFFMYYVTVMFFGLENFQSNDNDVDEDEDAEDEEDEDVEDEDVEDRENKNEEDKYVEDRGNKNEEDEDVEDANKKLMKKVKKAGKKSKKSKTDRATIKYSNKRTVYNSIDSHIDENLDKPFKTTLTPDIPYSELPASSEIRYLERKEKPNNRCKRLGGLSDPIGPIPDDGYKDSDENISRNIYKKDPKPVLPDHRPFDIIHKKYDQTFNTPLTQHERLRAMINASRMRNKLSRESEEEGPSGQLSKLLISAQTL